MEGEEILVGSKLRVVLPFVDRQRAADGTITITPIDLLTISTRSLTITTPSGEARDATGELEVEDAAAGLAHWDGTMTEPGVWRADALADGYKARATWVVLE